MRKLLLATTCLAFASGAASAADLYVKAPPKQPVAYAPWSWGGLYIGTHSAAVYGVGDFSNPFGASIFGDNVVTPGYMAGAQIGYNFQSGPWVFGLEADVSFADVSGTNTCGAIGGLFTSFNCRIENDWYGTVTARVGHAWGDDGRTLTYIKGGAAWVNGSAEVHPNNPANLLFGSSVVDYTRWGWTIGAGVERALSRAWSIKAEYNYMNFGNVSVDSPGTTGVIPGAGPVLILGGTFDMRQDLHAFKVGANYKWGENFFDWGSGGGVFASGGGYPTKGPAQRAWAPGWEFEFGGRYWYSSGRFQKDVPTTTGSEVNLISRLIYDDLQAHTGEAYGRIDTPIGLFVKGNIGGGSITGGKMNDEDWLLGAGGAPYSNTLSDLTSTPISYATADIGLSLMKGPGYKVGYFVGYNYWAEKMEANTCTQTAGAFVGICVPPIAGVPVITETDRWHSLRLGMNAEVFLMPGLKLSAEAAYLPYVRFEGVDNHWLRDLVINEEGRGRGVQLEAHLSYYITPNFSVGAGGRYWAAWTTTGEDEFVFSGVSNGITPRNDTYRAERYGGFLQASYRFSPDPAVMARY